MSFLLAVLLRGVVVALAGGLSLVLLRRASSATRRAVAVIALGAMLAVPLGLLVAPKREVPSVSFRAVPTSFRPIPLPLPGLRAPISQLDHVAVTTSRVVPQQHALSPEMLILAAWSLGALGLTLRMVVGWLMAWNWVRRSQPLPSERESFPEIRVSEGITVPCAVWAGRSVVLLPKGHVEWSEERRHAVLLHETAHLRSGDWAALVLTRLAVALHWPNPLAWALARTAQRAAEDAADDAVLRSGLAPADYADHLLALAPRRSRSALALPMATRPDLHRRIRLVLNPHRTRGSIGFVPLVLAGLLVGGIFVPAVSLVAGQRRRPALILNASPYRDVRGGWTRPGTPENGFIGRFADGTTAQVVQISMRTQGGVQAWKPNGDPIPEAQRRNVELLGDHYRSILVRYKKRTDEPEGGLGSGPRTKGEPSELGFNSSRNGPGPRPGEWESYQFIDVPKEDGDRASFTFTLTNEPWKVYRLSNEPWTFRDWLAPTTPTEKAPWGQLSDLRNVVVAKGIAAPALHDARGLYARDEKGNVRRSRVAATALSFVPPTNGKTLTAQVTARLRNGKTARPFWYDNNSTSEEPLFRYYFRQKPEAIASFEVRTRGYRSVEFHEVRLKPNAR